METVSCLTVTSLRQLDTDPTVSRQAVVDRWISPIKAVLNV